MNYDTHPECTRCHAAVHLRDGTEHSGFCDNCAHVLVGETAQQAARIAELERELADYKFVLGNRREHRFVNASPDAELPARILKAYIEDGTTESNPPELGEMMNKWQAERNAILRRAIDQLTRAETAESQLATALAQLKEGERCRESLVNEKGIIASHLRQAESALAAKTRELEEMAEDKARLDWLIANAHRGEEMRWLEFGARHGADVRFAIDAAMNKGGQNVE